MNLASIPLKIFQNIDETFIKIHLSLKYVLCIFFFSSSSSWQSDVIFLITLKMWFTLIVFHLRFSVFFVVLASLLESYNWMNWSKINDQLVILHFQHVLLYKQITHLQWAEENIVLKKEKKQSDKLFDIHCIELSSCRLKQQQHKYDENL